jgi:methylamine dehydrogenase heavy chain
MRNQPTSTNSSNRLVVRGTAALVGGFAAMLVGIVSAAEVRPDPLIRQDLRAGSRDHWVWVNDIVFHHMADGKSYLLDGDGGQMLGMLSTGYGFGGVVVPRDGSLVLSPEIYFSRGTRGTRTDVVTVYDGRTLDPVGEIAIPPKRASTIPTSNSAVLTDDERFLLVYNFTPAQSVTVVDMHGRKLVGEVDTPGCALVYPTGPRSFFSLCGDGTALVIRLDDSGQAVERGRTDKLFDVERDPVLERSVRDGDIWLFTSFAGDVVPVRTVNGRTFAGERWPLTTAGERQENWKPGGMQHLAVHVTGRRLYTLMHQGGVDTHKDPGSEVWVYDLDKRIRTQRIVLEGPLTSIVVTADAKPLLFGVFIGAPELRVFDALTGRPLRTISEVGFSPTIMTTY